MDYTKIELPTDVLVGFTAIYSNCHDDIIINRNGNIQRIELLNMKLHFNSLKKSKLTYVKYFYDQFTKAVGQHEFIVQGYLTLSLNHQFQNSAEVVMYPDKNSNVSVSPLKVCLF